MEESDTKNVSGSTTRATTAHTRADQDSIQVLVRVRPMHDLIVGHNRDLGENYDEALNAAIDIQSSTTLAVANTDGKRVFNCTYDHVLGPSSTQAELYDIVKKCTISVVEGFNATIFAYGQTGSGKTFSMYGPPNEFGNRSMQQDRSLIGVIPRAVQDVFNLSEQQDVIQVSVYVSFVQIYNEQLFDMLRDSSMISPLTIREDQGREIYVQGLSEYNVKSVSDTLQLLKIAEDNRTVRETHMNQFSSRSHSIFQIYVEQKKLSSEDGGEVYLRAKYNLVDLAGSEKWNLNKYMRDEHVTEMTNINLSLHTLGRCISSLAQRSLGKDMHVPFRDSKLTRLLQDSLGGNARTYLLATVSPLRANIEETISTLKFADNAKRVMVQAVMNETRPVDHAMVKRLQTEVERLRGLLRMAGLDVSGNPIGGPADNQSLELVQHQNQIASNSGLPIMSSQQPLAVGNLAGINLLTSLEGALQAEQEKVGKFRGENERLHKELKRLTAAGAGSNGSGGSGNGGDNAIKSLLVENIVIPINAANEAAAAINTVFQSHQLIWAEVNRMKQTVKKFFRFELEEETLKKSLDESFGALGNVQAQEGEVLNHSNTKSVLKSLGDAHSQGFNLIQNSTHSAQPISNHGLSRGAQSKVKMQTQPSVGSGIPDASDDRSSAASAAASAPFLPHSPSPHKVASISAPTASVSPARSEVHYTGLPAINDGARKQLPQQQLQFPQQQQPLPPKNLGARYADMPSSPVQTTEEEGSRQKLRQPSQPTKRQLKVPRNAAIAQLQQQPQPPQQQLIQRVPSQPLIQAPSNAGHRTPVGGISMRVRGSTESTTSSWTEAVEPSEQDEEAALQAELKKAKKKLQKQQQLQDWLREKENRAMQAQQNEEEQRRAAQEEEYQKEIKRREYVRKQKEKLTGYKMKIKQEANQIQELVDLGIDPSSLF